MFEMDKKLDNNFWIKYKKEIFQKAYDRGILEQKKSFFRTIFESRISISAPALASICLVSLIFGIGITLLSTKNAPKKPLAIVMEHKNPEEEIKKSKIEKNKRLFSTMDGPEMASPIITNPEK